jgi:hypothetical protein
MYISIYENQLCIYIYICIYTHVYTYLYYICTNTYHIYVYYLYIHTFIHSFIHTYIYIYRERERDTRFYLYMYICTCMYIHIYIQWVYRGSISKILNTALRTRGCSYKCCKPVRVKGSRGKMLQIPCNWEVASYHANGRDQLRLGLRWFSQKIYIYTVIYAISWH